MNTKHLAMVMAITFLIGAHSEPIMDANEMGAAATNNTGGLEKGELSKRIKEIFSGGDGGGGGGIGGDRAPSIEPRMIRLDKSNDEHKEHAQSLNMLGGGGAFDMGFKKTASLGASVLGEATGGGQLQGMAGLGTRAQGQLLGDTQGNVCACCAQAQAQASGHGLGQLQGHFNAGAGAGIIPM